VWSKSVDYAWKIVDERNIREAGRSLKCLHLISTTQLSSLSLFFISQGGVVELNGRSCFVKKLE
jgi:hypothetical protein